MTQLVSLASGGGLSKLLAAMRSQDEPQSHEGPTGRLWRGSGARRRLRAFGRPGAVHPSGPAQGDAVPDTRARASGGWQPRALPPRPAARPDARGRLPLARRRAAQAALLQAGTTPCLTSPHLNSSHLTAPDRGSSCLTLPHLTSPYLTSPYLSLPCLISRAGQHSVPCGAHTAA